MRNGEGGGRGGRGREEMSSDKTLTTLTWQIHAENITIIEEDVFQQRM
jgi:hypothetical protein